MLLTRYYFDVHGVEELESGHHVQINIRGEAHDQCKITIHVAACVMSQSCETNWTKRMTGHGGWQCSIEKDVEVSKEEI